CARDKLGYGLDSW
nr:immunoglobulin heavy chain junction region [Macaca mulatta]MOW80003.1 immunoglobulin heavy chain junction region [Macaca mulatta]MOW80491.1 immunoglobulin heavy chain junction region [Macaca mulatta]MOW81553.1 immunoglobulin heavy chain junction region [Macaca mulatta]MOW84381.1 immunoglobulin heavy chain junction region [Macaca mulatta]